MKKIRYNDVSVTVYETSESLYEYTAKFEDGWCEMRGIYYGYEITANELIIGCGGHARQASQQETEKYFSQIKDIILKKVETDIDNGSVVNTWRNTLNFIEDNYEELEQCEFSPDIMLGLAMDYF